MASVAVYFNIFGAEFAFVVSISSISAPTATVAEHWADGATITVAIAVNWMRAISSQSPQRDQ
jgi:hypothetical protein